MKAKSKRPRVTAPTAPVMVALQLQISRRLKDALSRRAKSERTTLNALVTRILADFVASKSPAPAEPADAHALATGVLSLATADARKGAAERRHPTEAGVEDIMKTVAEAMEAAFAKLLIPAEDAPARARHRAKKRAKGVTRH